MNNPESRDTANPFKATVIGGLVFLAPLTIIVFLAAQLVRVMRAVAEAIEPLVPLGVVSLNVIAVAGLVLICYVAGLVAQRARSGRLRDRIEGLILGVVPGYSFVKAFTDGMQRSEGVSQDFLPVLVDFDDYSQLAFEIERDDDRGRGQKAAVYLPGAPNPWSGAFVYVAVDRIHPLKMTIRQAFTLTRVLGKGSIREVERGALRDAAGTREGVGDPEAQT